MLPIDEDVVVLVQFRSTKEKFVLKQIGILYDILADAVDEINSIFSIEVLQFFALYRTFL